MNLLGVGKRIDHYKHLNIFFSTFDRSDPNGLHLTLDNGSVGFVTLAILKRVFFFNVRYSLNVHTFVETVMSLLSVKCYGCVG